MAFCSFAYEIIKNNRRFTEPPKRKIASILPYFLLKVNTCAKAPIGRRQKSQKFWRFKGNQIFQFRQIRQNFHIS